MSSHPRAALRWSALLLCLPLLLLAWRLRAAGEGTALWLVFALLCLPLLVTCRRPYTVLLEALTAPAALALLWAPFLHDRSLLELPLVAGMLAWAAWPLRSWLAMAWAATLTIGWAALAWPAEPGPGGWLLVAAAALTWTWVARHLQQVYDGWTPPRSIDLLLTSYSGNTGHMAARFLAGAREAGAQVRVHRLHYADDPIPRLDGDAMALAFPVVGWKPPWPLLDRLVLPGPTGRGRPACLLYSAGGGPENAGVLVQTILAAHGWRCVGRAWAQYAVNIATFRPGPKAMWRWLDSIVPFEGELSLVRELGRSFARGEPGGLPFLPWPSPLPVLGFVLDNRWLNRFLYRSHAFKRRCTGCGRCVRVCPVDRLTLVDGHPRAEGTCGLCLACINLCPTNAMQAWFFTEFGQPYPPRWPEYTVKRRGQPTRPD